MAKETISGIVDAIIFYNKDNGYAVCSLETDDTTETIVGNLPLIEIGDNVSVTGEFVVHLEYGEQFKVDYYEKLYKEETADILNYLSSGAIKGIRKATAKKIVEKFGDNTLDIIASDYERLTEIPSINLAKAEAINQSYLEQFGMRDLIMFLQRFDVSLPYASKIYHRYGNLALATIKQNPYMLAEEISGINFLVSQKIADKLGFDPLSPLRLRCGISYVLMNISNDGHTCYPLRDLLIACSQILNIDAEYAERFIVEMKSQGRLHIEQKDDAQYVSLPHFIAAEGRCASRLKKLAARQDEENSYNEGLIATAEKNAGILLANMQRQAVKTALTNGAAVITGGPGTGKTTIIRILINIMQSLSKSVTLTAPTGKAAKRMSELCCIEAKTIHRLLEAGFSDGSNDSIGIFGKNEDYPLETDMLIIDEMSMVDIMLFDALLKALPAHTRVIMVGDSDQLPSVGPGNVLRDIIDSGAVKVVRLTEIYRQAKESMIVVNAHSINHGQRPVLNSEGTDFFFINRYSGDDIRACIFDLCDNRLPKAYGFDKLTGIQVLTPARKGVAGVMSLNEGLQQKLNPSGGKKREKRYGDTIFREGDKVIQTKNNYNVSWKSAHGGVSGEGVYNGDVGVIQKIDLKNELIYCIFDDERIVEYEYSRLAELELAYALTVHKSQGCEFDAVVMPMFSFPPMLLNRNLLYTAVTRAKKLVVLVGRAEVLYYMVENVNERKRYTLFGNRLTES